MSIDMKHWDGEATNKESHFKWDENGNLMNSFQPKSKEIIQLTPNNLADFLSDPSFAIVRVWEEGTSLSEETMTAINWTKTRFAVLNIALFEGWDLEGNIVLEVPSVQLVQNGKVFHKITGTVRDNVSKVNMALAMNK